MSRFLIALILPILFCGFVILCYRPENTYLNTLLSELDTGWFSELRLWWQAHVPLADFLVYSLPGGLWVFVLSLLGWRLYLGPFNLFWLGLFFGLGFELTQLLGITDGTFDVLDLIAVLIGFTLARYCTIYWLPDEWRAEQGRWRYAAFFFVFFAAYGADVFV